MEYCLGDADGSATMWTADPNIDVDGDGTLDAVGLDFDGDGLVDDAVADTDGDGLPSGTGTVNLGQTLQAVPAPQTFTILNKGNANLLLTEPINLPAGFTLLRSFGSLVLGPGNSTTFVVALNAGDAASYFEEGWIRELETNGPGHGGSERIGDGHKLFGPGAGCARSRTGNPGEYFVRREYAGNREGSARLAG